MSLSMVLTIHCEGTHPTAQPDILARCTSFIQEQAMLSKEPGGNLFRRLKALESAAAASGWHKERSEHFCPTCPPSGKFPQGW